MDDSAYRPTPLFLSILETGVETGDSYLLGETGRERPGGGDTGDGATGDSYLLTCSQALNTYRQCQDRLFGEDKTTGSIADADQHLLLKPISAVTSPHGHNYLRR